LSEEDDFDIVPDDEGNAPRSTWLWVGITAVVALFAFGVGVAFMILSNRMGGDSPTPTPTTDLAAGTPTQLAAITGTVSLSGTPTITTSGTPTATPTISVTTTPSATATPFCTQPVESLLVPLYDQGQLGCPTGASSIVWAAFQPFERGSMLWRSDSDTSYVFYSDGDWFPIAEGWDGGPAADRGAPPPGYQAPQRGFGYVWSRNDSIFNGLGWARDQEKGFCALVQNFEKGFMLRSADVASCTPENLYNFATAGDWTPLLFAAIDDAQWRNVPSPNLPAEQGGERPEAGITRPAPNGIFDAHNATYTIDGNTAEWPNAWVPLNAIVFGQDQHAGPGDLSASFQVAWNDTGLVFAARVNDDLFRSGPQGTNLWQGDGIEVQFDRLLAEDFNTPTADGDDFQVGVAYDSDLGATQAYLWLPLDRESPLGVPSAVTISQQGYQIEFVIPWYLLDILEAPSTNRAYGFNISVNDNDGDTPAQQTVLSASPARATHDNPTQWGTLRLLP
jgi:hypothetical protein